MGLVYDKSATLNGTDSGGGNGGFNIRTRIRAADLSSFASGANVAVTCQFGSACPTESGSITGIYIGRESASPLHDFTGDQVQLLTGGVAAVDGAAGKVFTTDVTALGTTYDNTKDLLVSFFFKAGSNATITFGDLGANKGGYFFDDGAHTSTASQTSPPAFDSTSLPTNTGFVTKIDITTGGGGGGGSAVGSTVLMMGV